MRPIFSANHGYIDELFQKDNAFCKRLVARLVDAVIHGTVAAAMAVHSGTYNNRIEPMEELDVQRVADLRGSIDKDVEALLERARGGLSSGALSSAAFQLVIHCHLHCATR